MEVSKTNTLAKNDSSIPKLTVGYATRKSFACAVSADECKVNVNSSPHYNKLYRQSCNNKAEKQGPKTSGLNSNQCSFTFGNTDDISKTSWPELTVSFQRHGNRSKLANRVSSYRVLKEDIKPGAKVSRFEGTGSDTSKSDIADYVLAVQANISDTPFQDTSYSCKTKGCNSVEERQFGNSATLIELNKSPIKNAHKSHVISSREPQVSSGTHVKESERSTSCAIASGVAFEKQICGNDLATAGTSKVLSDVASGGRMEVALEHLQKEKNLPQPQSEEQESTISGSSNPPLDQRRPSRRRKAWKEEKKRMREEEIRRRMLAPKGQRLRLVSQEMMEMLLHGNTENVSFSTYQYAVPTMNEMEFPTVEESRKQRMWLNEELSSGVQGGDVHQEISKSEVQLKLKNSRSSNSSYVKSSCAEEEVIVPANSTSEKKKKRKDPIQIDLVNLIKTKPSRSNKGQGSVSKVSRQVQKRDSVVQYSGNQLDASNPERKRGKKKEVPKKKKITALKNAILEGRKLRHHLRELQEKAESVDLQLESSQKQDNVTASSSAHTEVKNNSILKQVAQSELMSGTSEFQNLCVTEIMSFGEVTDGNVKKAEDVNNTEILDLTQYLQKVSLNTNVQTKIHEQTVSCVPESAQEMIHKTEMGDDNCNLVFSGSSPSGYTDVLQRPSVHSRKFREYCDNSLTVPLNSAVKLLLKDIVMFQDRQYHRDPVKAFAKRRYIVGFREVKKYLHLKRLKLIIIAPDLEVAKTKGGIDDTVAQLKEEAMAQGVTYLFALSRRELGYLSFKKVKVSSIGICSYEGSENNFKDVMESLAGAREHYKQQTQHTGIVSAVGTIHEPDSSRDETTTVTSQVIASLLSKLTGSSSGVSTSLFLSAIEQTASLETED